MEPLARRSGYSLIVTHRLGDDDAGPIDLLLEKEVDAVAFLSTSVYRDDAPMRRLRQRGMPTVLINRPQLEPIVSRVAWDNRGGARAAVEHLHRLGHRRIGHLRGPLDRESTVERLRGYRQGLAAHDIPYRPEYVRPGDYTAPAGETASSVAWLLDLRPAPTAIVAADDMIAAVAIQAAAARRLRVPDDLALVGIDDQRLASFLVPPLTTVRLPVAEAGARALELLLERIADPDLMPVEVVMPTRLVVRQSCGAGTSEAT
jgi:LacI family repressor for deo operon, udp, cdd, tsx, nupC, and nupG